MSSAARLKSDFLLSRNRSRLFFISFFSFVFRWGALSSTGVSFYLLVSSDYYKFLLNTYNKLIIVTATVLLFSFILTGVAMLVSAVKLGEQLIFFTRAQGSHGRFLLLFRYLHPKNALRAFTLYSKIFLLKSLWLLYFLLPFIICIGCSGYLYSLPSLPQSVCYVLRAGSFLILSLSVVIWRLSAVRYDAASYYLCLNRQISPNNAIKKSIRFTDGFLAERFLLEYSFTGWFLSCIFIVPIIYVVPKFKLSKCIFITEVVFSGINTQKNETSGEHINQRHYKQLIGTLLRKKHYKRQQ